MAKTARHYTNHLRGKDFTGRDLSGSKFHRIAIRGCEFLGCKLDGCVFEECWIFGNEFYQCSFVGAKFIDTEVTYNGFMFSDFTGVIWENCQMPGGCNFRGVKNRPRKKEFPE